MSQLESRRALGLSLLCFAATSTFAEASWAQNAPPQLESLLRKTLNAVQSGAPNYSDMEPMLADQVEQQLAPMRQRFAALGAIRAIEFRGIQSTPSGPAEYYRVRFDNGQMAWMINLSPSKKISVLWSPG